jgi:hypothetical protein
MKVFVPTNDVFLIRIPDLYMACLAYVICYVEELWAEIKILCNIIFLKLKSHIIGILLIYKFTFRLLSRKLITIHALVSYFFAFFKLYLQAFTSVLDIS